MGCVKIYVIMKFLLSILDPSKKIILEKYEK